MLSKVIPKDISAILFRMKHEMDFSDVVRTLTCNNEWTGTDTWSIRRIELAFQAHARDGLIIVEQQSGGIIGQVIRILPRNSSENTYEVGYSWRTYDRVQMDALYQWGMNNKEKMRDEECTKESWFEKQYSTWKEDLGNGLIKIRLMVSELPSWSQFIGINQSNMFNIFPGFLPITVIIPSKCVFSVLVQLNQHQIAVKYDFEDDIEFASDKINAMALAKSSSKRNKIVMELIEFLIVKPTMLVHSYKMRDSIYTKLEEFMVWIDDCDDIKYTHYIRNMVDRMTNVLSMVLQDPLCVKY